MWFWLIYCSWYDCGVCAAESDAIDICKSMFCGKGTCQASETELLGFTCDCDSGWKKIKVGVPPLEFELPPCLLPNCQYSFLP